MDPIQQQLHATDACLLACLYVPFPMLYNSAYPQSCFAMHPQCLLHGSDCAGGAILVHLTSTDNMKYHNRPPVRRAWADARAWPYKAPIHLHIPAGKQADSKPPGLNTTSCAQHTPVTPTTSHSISCHAHGYSTFY